MVTYDQLTDAQKADLATYDVFMRGTFAALAKVAKEANPAVMYAFAQANITPLLPTLDPATEIPTGVGYAGAKRLTAEEFAAGRDLLDQLNGLLAANLPLLAKMAGVNAG